jgi:hypothetical protein
VKKRVWRSDSTLPSNLDIINNHLRPTLGSTFIHLISWRDLQALLDRKADEGRSYSLVLVQDLHSLCARSSRWLTRIALSKSIRRRVSSYPNARTLSRSQRRNREGINAVMKLLSVCKAISVALWARRNRVVPFAVEAVGEQLDGGKFLLADLDPFPRNGLIATPIFLRLIRTRERLISWLATGGGGLRPSEIQGLRVADMKEEISIERRFIGAAWVPPRI